MAKKKKTGFIEAIAVILAVVACIGVFAALFKDVSPSEEPATQNDSGKLYSYAVLSDIHMRSNDGATSDGVVSEDETGYRDSVADFTRAVNTLNTAGVEFAFITGDVGYDSTKDELKLYQNVRQKSKIPYYVVRGNHDTGFSDTDWYSGTGNEENFEVKKGNDVFLGMSMYETGSTSASATTPFGENATWLHGKLDEHKGKRIFVMMHFPMPGGAGLRDGESYGFASGSIEATNLDTKFKDTNNVVVFSGHTHFEFGVEETYPNINVYDVPDKNVNYVHVPSVAYPRDKDKTEVAEKSQCYIVDVYKTKVVLRGCDLVTGLFMEDYVYTLYNDGTVKRVGDTSNDNSSSDSTTGDSATGDSTTTTVTAITGSMLPVSDTVYGGVCGVSTAVYQLKSANTVTGSFDFTFRNLSVTSSDTVVYMAGDSVTTIRLEGTNTIDTSSSAKTTQRTISSSGTSGNYLIGVGVGAELILKGHTAATTEVIKGNWTIENATVITTGTTNSTYAGVELVNGKGISLRKNAAFSLNSSKVQLNSCTNGYLELHLGTAIAGTSTLTITPYANTGYTLTAILVNGVQKSPDTALTMPATGETLTIQGVFTKTA